MRCAQFPQLKTVHALHYTFAFVNISTNAHLFHFFISAVSIVIGTLDARSVGIPLQRQPRRMHLTVCVCRQPHKTVISAISYGLVVHFHFSG